MKQKLSTKILVNAFFIIFCLTFLVPCIYVISLSVSTEDVIRSAGYSLIPKEITLDAYKMISQNPKQLIDSYKITTLASVLGTFLSMVVMLLAAYPLSRKEFGLRRGVTFFMYFTMLFSGGLIPSYIINTKYLGLSNSFWIYILPSLASAYYILIIRTFFSSLPDSLAEAARIDGACEFSIFFRIILPLSKPVIATVTLLMLLTKWNDWYTCLIYIRDADKYTLQYLLQKILQETEFLQKMSQDTSMLIDIDKTQSLPLESMRFAMAILAAGPMVVIFPFFQKYFTKGLTLGSVKG